MKPWIKAAYINLEGGEDMPKTKQKAKGKKADPIVTGKKAKAKKKK